MDESSTNDSVGNGSSGQSVMNPNIGKGNELNRVNALNKDLDPSLESKNGEY